MSLEKVAIGLVGPSRPHQGATRARPANPLSDDTPQANPKVAAPKAGRACRTEGHCLRRMGAMDDAGRAAERIVPRGRGIHERRVRPGPEREDGGASVATEVEGGEDAIAGD